MRATWDFTWDLRFQLGSFGGSTDTPKMTKPQELPGVLRERETRFELATSTLARLHSTTELLPQIINQ